MPDEAEITLRILVAVGLGGAIGLERELAGHPAGLRTHISVALGAALFAIVSAYSWTEFAQDRAETNYQIDVTRVASNVVTGVGFLGGGAILKHGATVRGLTTAASLWVAAAAGLAAGLGTYFAAGVATVTLILCLTALRIPRRFLRRVAKARENIAIRLHPGADSAAVVGRLERLERLDIRSLTLRRAEDESGSVISVDVRATNLEGILAELADWDEVSDVDIDG